MEENNEMINTGADVVSGVDTVKKGKAGVIAASVTAAAVALVAGGGVLAYSLSDFVKNQVKLRFSKPENYYTWVTEKNSDEMAQKLSTTYKETLKAYNSGNTSAASVKYEISDGARKMLIDEIFGTDQTGFDEEEQAAIDFINGAKSIKLGMDSVSDTAVMSGSTYLDFNDQRLITVDVSSDMEELSMFFRIPELTERWILVEAGKNIDDDDLNELRNAYKQILKDPESVLTPEELEKEIQRYMGVWNDSIGEVDLTKKEEVDIDSITVKYTVAEIEFDQAKAKTLAENFINSAREDEILRSVLVERTEAVTEEELNEFFSDALEEINDHMEDGSSDGKLIVKTYIDPNGDIRGVEMTSPEDDGEIRMIVGKDGDQIRGEMVVKNIDDEDFRAVLHADDEKGKLTGYIEMKSDDENVSVEFADLEVVNEEKGYMNGTVTFVVPDIDPVSIALNSDGKSQKIGAEIVVNGTNYGKVILEYSVDKGGEPTVPDKSGAFLIDTEEDPDLTEYVNQEQLKGFISGMIGKLGLTDMVEDDDLDDLIDTIYRRHSYDDWDLDYDDDDYDWDDDDWDDWDDDDFGYHDQLSEMAGKAYIYIADKDFNATLLGGYGNLAGDAVYAKIEGDGSYTVSVNAKGLNPSGISILNIAAEELPFEGDPQITVKSVKIDGKEYPVKSAPSVIFSQGYLSASLYADSEYGGIYENAVDCSTVGDWKTIEITFDIKGLK